jgi:hypothetical protein
MLGVALDDAGIELGQRLHVVLIGRDERRLEGR